MTEKTRLHLVAGFLGSGKTTAIVNACKVLSGNGLRVGVVTNDQGKFLVDTAFFRLEDIPAVEVGGGCFCCHYSNLEEQLYNLIDTLQPDVIFAESVGSCADIVATVVKPMFELQSSPLMPTSFSVFVDARLLRLRLNDIPLPFSDSIAYIFDQQIEEAGLLVINKVDLLTEAQNAILLDQASERWPEKTLLPQTSLSSTGVQPWLEEIEYGSAPIPEKGIPIDYARYADGERRLAWLDQEVVFEGRYIGLRAVACDAVGRIMAGFERLQTPIGHVKFILQGSASGEGRINFPTLYSNSSWQDHVPNLQGERLALSINARVEMPASELKALIRSALSETAGAFGLTWRSELEDAFHPADPNPEYRL